jgi:hypothetical protein
MIFVVVRTRDPARLTREKFPSLRKLLVRENNPPFWSEEAQNRKLESFESNEAISRTAVRDQGEKGRLN